MFTWDNLWESMCSISFTTEFALSFFSIIMIDIILSGDNAVVIALAVRSLTGKKRLQGIIFGTGLAVLLRVTLTFFCARLLEVSFLKFVGGCLIAWIAVKLLISGNNDEHNQREVHTLGKAIVTIMIADFVMSTDNVLAVAGACKGNLALLLFGIGCSIPLVVFTSNILSKLMDKYPVIVTLGAAVLGRVAGEMIANDAFITKTFHPSTFTHYALQALFAVGVVAAGKLWVRWKAMEVTADERS